MKTVKRKVGRIPRRFAAGCLMLLIVALSLNATLMFVYISSKENVSSSLLPLKFEGENKSAPFAAFDRHWQWRNNTAESLLDSTSPLAVLPETDLIVTFVNHKYLDVLSVWVHHYQKRQASFQKRPILCLVALSSDAYDAIEEYLRGFSERELGYVMLTQVGRHRNIWELRVNFLSDLLSAWGHINVLMTDLDAIWVDNPFEIINQHGNASLVASQGKFPAQCGLGSTESEPVVSICMGFVYFRNGASIQQLVKGLSTKFKRYGRDDQRALNCLLKKEYNSVGAPIEIDQGGLVTTRSLARDDSNSTDLLNIVILPYSIVYRFCEEDSYPESVVVLHCFVSKSGHSKIEGFRNMGLITDKTALYDWGRRASDTHEQKKREPSTGDQITERMRQDIQHWKGQRHHHVFNRRH